MLKSPPPSQSSLMQEVVLENRQQQLYKDGSLQLWITPVHSGCPSAHTVITSPPLHTTPVHVGRGWVDYFPYQNEGSVFLAGFTKTDFIFFFFFLSVVWVKKQNNMPGSSYICSSGLLFLFKLLQFMFLTRIRVVLGGSLYWPHSCRSAISYRDFCEELTYKL